MPAAARRPGRCSPARPRPAARRSAGCVARSGFAIELDETDDGRHALKQLKLGAYDFAFIDVKLGGIDGLELACQIQPLGLADPDHPADHGRAGAGRPGRPLFRRRRGAADAVLRPRHRPRPAQRPRPAPAVPAERPDGSAGAERRSCGSPTCRTPRRERSRLIPRPGRRSVSAVRRRVRRGSRVFPPRGLPPSPPRSSSDARGRCGRCPPRRRRTPSARAPPRSGCRHPAPTICTPSTRSVAASARTFTKPSGVRWPWRGRWR